MEDFALNWQVLLIVIFLVGVLGAIATAVYKATKMFCTTAETFRVSINELRSIVDAFKQSCEWIRCKNDEEHDEFTERLDDHETTLTDHEKRIWELRNRFKD